MPYASAKRMEWGPRIWPDPETGEMVTHEAFYLEPGDEVPVPFKKNLLNPRIPVVKEVKAIEGKLWADQPEERRKAWAWHCLSIGVHPTQLVEGDEVGAEAKAPPAKAPVQEVAAADATPPAEVAAPPRYDGMAAVQAVGDAPLSRESLDAAIVTDVEAELSTASEPPKRRRGRPRKQRGPVPRE